MTPPTRPQPRPSVVARIIHAAMMVGVILLTAVAWLIAHQRGGSAGRGPNVGPLYIPLAVMAIGTFAGAFVVAGRLPPPAPGQTAEAWWTAHQTQATIIWALVEAPALFAGVIYLTGGDPRALLVTLAALALFLHFAPGRLAGQA